MVVRITQGLSNDILYHPGKDNVVVDSLRRFHMGITVYFEENKKEIRGDVHRTARLGHQLMHST